ncbi:unnamed protein product [Toxocara canis]|uniref:Uncharacterized protein n=1 Tax=Toxocara canis TaxID=6265 RepID=A0A183U2J3_TOXCA|nr:unnamed protein product [Toxocara canis]
MTYPQRRRTQSATPRLNSANENDDIAEEGCNVVAGAANGNKPVPKIESAGYDFRSDRWDWFENFFLLTN